jgi:uncharacterized membrane protein
MAEGKGPFRSMLGATFAGAREKVAGIFRKGKGKSGGRQKLKVTDIVESIDVGVPVRLAYNQWTQFRDFPTFMKKVENVEQAEDEKLNWKAQVFWSHRTWESTIVEQQPDEAASRTGRSSRTEDRPRRDARAGAARGSRK